MSLDRANHIDAVGRAMVNAVVASAGLLYEEPKQDFVSVDVTIQDNSTDGIVAHPMIKAQVKGTARLRVEGEHFMFPLEMKNYNDLRLHSQTPVILIVAVLPSDLPEDLAGWLTLSNEELLMRGRLCWRSLMGEPDVPNTTTRSVSMPINQRFGPAELVRMIAQVREGNLL